jgi:hypothetical protein
MHVSRRQRGVLSLLLAVATTTGPLSAQTPAPLVSAAETISAVDIARHVGVIAADSMLGRDTPSHGLELTAQYVADQFKALGLRPGAGDTTFIQRYPLPGQLRLDYTKSDVFFYTTLTQKGKEIVPENGEPIVKQIQADFTTAARFAPEVGLQSVPAMTSSRRSLQSLMTDPAWPGSMNTVLVAGRHTTESLRRADVHDKVVLYVPPVGIDPALRQQLIQQLYTSSRGLVILSDEDSVTFTQRLQRALQQPVRMADQYLIDAAPETHDWSWAVYVRSEVIRYFLSGVDLARAGTDSAAVVHDLPSTWVFLRATPEEMTPNVATAPNTVGILEGSDPKLKDEYLVFTAHMDHVGPTRGQADSIHNGADDNASGTAGLIALAKAFSQPDARPRRSVVFLAVSGGAKDFWGSKFFLEQERTLAANLNLDMIGRNTDGVIAVDGLSDLEFATTPDLIAAVHPELHLTLTDGGTAVQPRSDHFPFIHAMVPSLSFHTGTHADDPKGPDSPQTIDADQEARILRLIFYVGQEIANAKRPPRWSLSGRERFLQTFGH